MNDLLKVPNQQYQQIGAVVMNANPFTLGHRYLVEKAAKENDFVYVFVVSANTSLFSADERLQLVREGLSDLDNVVVVAGGDYMVSYATFPAYFCRTMSQRLITKRHWMPACSKSRLPQPCTLRPATWAASRYPRQPTSIIRR